MTRVLVVDDQDLIRAGFRLILERAGAQVVADASNGLEAVELAAALQPDVVLMDIRMPVLDGIEATRRIVAAQPSVRVLVLTTFGADEYVYRAVRAGASGFLLKDCSPDALVHAVETVKDGDVMLAPAVTRRLLDEFVSRAPGGRRAAELAVLTEREREVTRLVGQGLSNQEIAAELFLTGATVRTYVSRLLTKLSLRDRVQVAILAHESGLVRRD